MHTAPIPHQGDMTSYDRHRRELTDERAEQHTADSTSSQEARWARAPPRAMAIPTMTSALGSVRDRLCRCRRLSDGGREIAVTAWRAG